MNKFIFLIQKNFDYFQVGNFRTKKLEGTVELRNAGLPGADAYIASPQIYHFWKRDGKFPKELRKELKPVVEKLIKKYKLISIRTCFRFSGYENPRNLPAIRDLKSVKAVLKGIEDTYKVGENFAKENDIEWFDLGLIIMGRVVADKSGIIIVDPEKSNLCVVESCLGDIHLIAVGEDDFDSFWVNSKGKIIRKEIRKKQFRYDYDGRTRKKSKVAKSKIEEPIITDREAKELAKFAFQAAKYHKTSVEIEYLVRKDGFVDMYELQERPGFVLELPQKEEVDDKALVSGITVNPGKVEGIVKVAKSLDEVKEVAPGTILVLPASLMGEDMPVIAKIGAIVCDTGGLTAHISTIAKECGVPCVVGTKNASKVLQSGMKVMVNASSGKVYPSTGQSVQFLSTSDHVVWLDDMKATLHLVGAKAFNLIALSQLDVNVPDAYIITTEAFTNFLKENKLQKLVQKELSDIDVEELGKTQEILQDLILKGNVSKKLEQKIFSSFTKLKKKYGSVSVRSSATCEDSVKASFAGQFQSFLFVDDKKTLIDSLKRCWASLYRAGAILYAIQHGIDFSQVKMGVVVQGMIDADMAGVMFTKNIEGNEDTMLIESATGIGEHVVSGEVTPSSYVVSKKTGRMIKRKEQDSGVLNDILLSKLSSLGRKVEKTFGYAQDIEWAVKKEKVFILQSRPITV